MALKPNQIPRDLFAKEGVLAGTHDGFTYAMDNRLYESVGEIVTLEPSAAVESASTLIEPQVREFVAQIGRPALQLVASEGRLVA